MCSKPGLNRIQPSVEAFDIVVVFLRLAVVAQHFDFTGQIGIICCCRPSLTTCSKIFPGIEAERSRMAMEPAFIQRLSLFEKYSAPCAWHASSITMSPYCSASLRIESMSAIWP